MGILSKALGVLSPSVVVADAVVAESHVRPIIHLKMKVCSLADESRLIRREEARLIDPRTGRRDNPTRLSLMNHRKKDIRPEARAALLAYGYLRGRSYKNIEHTSHTVPNWSRVRDLVVKYGPPFEGTENTPGEYRRSVLTTLSKWAESA